ncbi:glycosyltransferase family 4 protein [Bacillus methanolicus]|uniref:Alpha-D-mannose-alpha(1-6)phosphatidyl myo-inositol monomannoside transferase n=1 Tax=Bacillus methanolicus (strain MGA3 / ATCC 53907) TaxID=796606 RepID=I3EBY6_BACMM|nr:glycosyltransferase family 1 protein [Bacillus methanolicus]AIE61685.1 alpha-D-mannose-alpha(1-6)phosphatidyl myo-inositol monomannoside transferase [Bacillus methanolicus MGA3]EIJ84007.1 alpha-D-mannose-alpha(1-6)phosphatidyl myo-inositol monomannoside transferase [Bacillus methanolicus MGA3]
MRIALFSDTFYPQVNGVARTLKRLTDHMEKRGIEYEIFVPELEDGIMYPNTHQFTSFPFLFYPECRTAIANPYNILKRVSDFSPDLVHIATPLTMGLYGIHAAKRLGIPMVASYHTHFDQYLKYYKLTWLSSLLWRYMKWFHTPFEKIFVPSSDTKEYLEERGFHNLSIWSRGVDCCLFNPEKKNQYLRNRYQIKERYILLYVGRLSLEKDLHTLYKIIEEMPAEFQKEIHWVIAGDGPSYKEVLDHVKDKKNATLTGYLDGEELAKAYAEADLFVFPSTTETFGNVVLEALASGTPAIVADSGGVTRIVQNNATGMICRAHDHEHFLETIQQLLIDEMKREKMGHSARTYALKQSWESIFDGLIEEYKEVIFKNKKKKMLLHA